VRENICSIVSHPQDHRFANNTISPLFTCCLNLLKGSAIADTRRDADHPEAKL
jgi:hypothetical protein